MTITEEKATTSSPGDQEEEVEIPAVGDAPTATAAASLDPTITTIAEATPATMGTYHNPNVRAYAIGSAVGQLGAFFGCFFGIRGPNGEWPDAWWSLCFLGTAISQYFNMMNALPSEIKLTENNASPEGSYKAFDFYNLYGRRVSVAPFPMIDSIEYTSRCCTKSICITWADAGYEKRRQCAGNWKCCVGRKCYFPLPPSDAERMIADYERHSSNNANGKKHENV